MTVTERRLRHAEAEQVQQVQGEMRRVDLWPNGSVYVSFPPMDVYDEGECLRVYADLPGISREDVEISATAHTLSLKGEVRGLERGEALWKERVSGRFTRTVQLPCPIRPEAIEATFSGGLLVLMLPKAEEARPHTVEIR
ncbi:MAG: Hsp20/alpha crystallin family protein [Clostridia bacterium]|nr:Hsp20/alpha crystallin family protein [Clostridia bacterium]